MAKLSKKRKEALSKVDSSKVYSVEEAAKIIKQVSTAKFDASVDLNIRLGVDPRKADQLVRGTVTLPHGTGKNKTVLVLCSPDKQDEAKKAGADYVGLDDFIEKIKSGWTDVDVIITMPGVMPKVGGLGKILGPRGLMPNPKSGTVTTDITKAVEDVKKGKIEFKVDKYGIIHSLVAKTSFEDSKIADNAKELLQTILKAKPSSAKGSYFKSISMSSTMSPGVRIDPNSIEV